MYGTTDRPSAPKGTKNDKEALSAWNKLLETGKYDFKRVVFVEGDFKNVSKALNEKIAPLVPESTPEKIGTFLVGAMNSYQTGLVRSERFKLIAEKPETLEAPREEIKGGF